MIFNLDDNVICDNNASVATVAFDFSEIVNWAFADCASTFLKFDVSSGSDSVKSLLSAWVLIVIFWNCCFKRRARCRLWKHSIVAFAFRSCWLRKLLTSSFYFVVELVSASAIRLRVFSIGFKFFSELSERGVWVSISFSPSFISFKIESVVITNYVSSPSFRKIETIKIVKL